MKKILLIDDDVDFNDALKGMLQYAGYEVVTAFDGKQGLEKFKTEDPDLVITDIIMPDIDGIGFLLSMKNTKSKTKVIVISAGGRIAANEYLDTAKCLGADEILNKPLDKDMLLGRIEALL